MKKTLFLYVLLVSMPTIAWAQYSVCGKVTREGFPQDRAVVSIQETGKTLRTNLEGDFCFSGLEAGTYHLLAASSDGFAAPAHEVFVSEDITGLTIEIFDHHLDEVRLHGKESERGFRESHSIKTEVVNVRQQAQSALSVEQMMNRSAGIRIRNTGGLGSNADVVVGGFNGKSIKFLIDGIPMDYLGSNMGLTRIPSGAADFIEVYKGVMPTEVGIDALGGAINIVTKRPDKDTFRVSYEFGSFNTHKVDFTTFFRPSDKLSYGINGFVNYSDNDYKVDHLPLEDPATGQTEYIRAKLFHNAFQQYSVEAFVNFENRTWADLFRLKINSFTIKNEVQNDFSSRQRPFGEVYRREYAYAVPSLEYKKSFAEGRFKISQFIVFSQIKRELADKIKNARYDWTGEKRDVSSGSEMGSASATDKPVTQTRLNNLTYRGLFTYDFDHNRKLILNVVDNYLNRKTDNLSDYSTQDKTDYNRLIAGLGYQYEIFDNRMEGLSQVKFLSSRTSGTVIDEVSLQNQKTVNNSGWSFAQSFKFSFYNGLMLRASIENTYRLPDQNEIFGDDTFIITNLSLKPERSLNINLGARYRLQQKLHLEINSYYRDVKDLIRLKDLTQFTAQFINLDKVRGLGVELSGRYNPIEAAEISGNLTYNDFRFQGSNQNIGNNEHFKNARVANMPFYFGNARAAYNFNGVVAKADNLQLYWAYTYVHQYYLDFIEKKYEPSGFLGLFGHSKIYTNRIIPVQQIHSPGFVWSKAYDNGNKIAFSGELDNLFNESIYNAFKMQSPGRNFSVKITYEF